MTAAPRLRVLVAPQEFKGSLTAAQAAEAIAEGVRRAAPDAEIRMAPMADGGPGTLEAIARGGSARLVRSTVRGPLGDPVEAAWALLEGDGPLAVVEQAAASGLVLLAPERRDATLASTFGTGEQIRAAVEAGARRLIVGAGGTATNDGGAGAAQALGVRLLDPAGRDLPPGGIHLVRLARVVPPAGARADAIDVRIAVDVRNPLLGPEGATAVYGPQKGLHDWQAPALEAALARWAERLRDDLGIDVAAVDGAGAGGGLPAGILAAFPHARIESGAALVASAIDLEPAVREAGLVITGEGSLDAQTAYGKAVAHVVALAAGAGVPCLAVAGVIDGRPEGVADAEALAAPGEDPGAAIREAAARCAAAAETVVARFLGWRGG